MTTWNRADGEGWQPTWVVADSCLLSNGSDLLGISPYLQQAIIGAVIVPVIWIFVIPGCCHYGATATTSVHFRYFCIPPMFVNRRM